VYLTSKRVPRVFSGRVPDEVFSTGRRLVATIKDVARVAGVSIATVSATLNGTARVSEKHTQRVWDAVRAVGYTPHAIARSLRLGHSRSIGLVLGDISNPFFTSLAKAVEARASAAGYLVTLVNSDENPEKEANLLRVLLEQRVAGILLAPAGYGQAYLKSLAAIAQVPTVLVDRQLPGDRFDAVIVDNRAAARMVTDYLVSLKHERVAIIVGRQHLSTSVQRLHGFRESLKAAGLKPSPELEVEAESRIDTAYTVTQRLLRMANRPSAIFAANNLMMLGAMEAILDLGFDCPGEISLAGVDDFEGGSAIRPRLTTVSQPIEAMGFQAVDRLLQRIAARSAGSQDTAQVTVLQPAIQIRDSCARPKHVMRKARGK
jgi:LacI family transcriptional regulator